jgi:hypothetical protein
MPIRNPFRRAPGAEAVDETQRNATDGGFKSTTVSGAPPTSIKESTEYKLSGEAPSSGAQMRVLRIERAGAYRRA